MFQWSGGEFPIIFKCDGYNHFQCHQFYATHFQNKILIGNHTCILLLDKIVFKHYSNFISNAIFTCHSQLVLPPWSFNSRHEYNSSQHQSETAMPLIWLDQFFPIFAWVARRTLLKNEYECWVEDLSKQPDFIFLLSLLFLKIIDCYTSRSKRARIEKNEQIFSMSRFFFSPYSPCPCPLGVERWKRSADYPLGPIRNLRIESRRSFQNHGIMVALIIKWMQQKK